MSNITCLIIIGLLCLLWILYRYQLNLKRHAKSRALDIHRKKMRSSSNTHQILHYGVESSVSTQQLMDLEIQSLHLRQQLRELITTIQEKNYELAWVSQPHDKEAMIYHINTHQFELIDAFKAIVIAVTGRYFKSNHLEQYALQLGPSFIRSLYLIYLICKDFSTLSPQHHKSFYLLWQEAILTAHLTYHIGSNLNLYHTAELTTQALLSHTGSFIICTQIPSLYHECIDLKSQCLREQAKINFNAYVIGRLLCNKWQFPKAVKNSITNQYAFLDIDTSLVINDKSFKSAAIIYISKLISRSYIHKNTLISSTDIMNHYSLHFDEQFVQSILENIPEISKLKDILINIKSSFPMK